PFGTSPGPGSTPGATVKYLKDLVQNRINADYMRTVHDGRCHWFHTIIVSRVELDRVFD
ncbi:hypothetical protein BGW80DRAFT_1330773, partial [Lactifluus volemus]